MTHHAPKVTHVLHLPRTRVPPCTGGPLPWDVRDPPLPSEADAGVSWPSVADTAESRRPLFPSPRSHGAWTQLQAPGGG